MKKLICILAVSAMLFNSMGYLIVFKCTQYSIKKEIKKKIKSGLSEKNLIVITLAPNDLKKRSEMEWLENKEFRYQGRMYDVVRSTVQGDTTIYYCINDVQEEQLFAHLDQMVKHQCESSPAAHKNAEKILRNFVREAIPEKVEITKPCCSIDILPAAFVFYSTANTPDVPSPPPEA